MAGFAGEINGFLELRIRPKFVYIFPPPVREPSSFLSLSKH